MMRLGRAMTVVVGIGLALAGCKGGTPKTEADAARDFGGQSLVVNGSTTVNPVAQAFADYFNTRNADIKLGATGSGDGIKALIAGQCDVAMASRGMKPTEIEAARAKGLQPTVFTIGYDGICVVVHPSRQIDNLTKEQVKGIFTGQIKDWSEVGGRAGEIQVISRDASSGTFGMFKKLALDGASLEGAKASEVKGNSEMKARVAENESAIGYLGMAYVDQDVRVVSLNGVEPTEATIGSGDYPLARALYLITAGRPAAGSLKQAFVSFCQSRDGAAMVKTTGYIPLPMLRF